MKCSYCSKEAEYTLKNGKFCCQPNYQSCPEIKVKAGKKISESLKRQYAEGSRESHFVKLNDGSIWKGRSHSDKTKNKLSKKSAGRKMSEEFKESRSIEMKHRYETGWESKAGRTKKIEYDSPIAGLVKLDGSWELATAEYLDHNKINWQRNKKRFAYVDSIGKCRTYCPDFYLVDSNTYVEVKGYATELDQLKWKLFTETLEIWDKSILRKKHIIQGRLAEWLMQQFAKLWSGNWPGGSNPSSSAICRNSRESSSLSASAQPKVDSYCDSLIQITQASRYHTTERPCRSTDRPEVS